MLVAVEVEILKHSIKALLSTNLIGRSGNYSHSDLEVISRIYLLIALTSILCAIQPGTVELIYPALTIGVHAKLYFQLHPRQLR